MFCRLCVAPQSLIRRKDKVRSVVTEFDTKLAGREIGGGGGHEIGGVQKLQLPASSSRC